MIKKYYILIVSAFALTSCNNDLFSDAEYSDAVELTGINASVETGTTTRSASDVVYLEDHISRYQFVYGDKMTFTKIQRTDNAIDRFNYKDVAFNSNASGAWERDKDTGSSLKYPDVHPERIYWSDATSPHTFVGYSLPKDNSSFDWKKSTYYYDKDGTQQNFETYYGAIGDPLNATEVIDYNPVEPATETITVNDGKEEKPLTFGYSQKLRDEDLLLTYDDMLTADNSVANIKFRHALSSVRVIVNISGFYGTATDAYSKVSNMILKNQPTLYRWKQQSAAVDALLTSNENTTLQQTELWGTSAPAYNQRKNMKLWNTNPEGTGEGAGKLFTFYGITVPQDADYFTAFPDYQNLEMSFKVTYPDPMKNDPINKTISKTYTASLTNPVKFYPGKCTTINISLNHKDETMTVGASYEDWEYHATPDEGTLKKKETFLSKAPSLENRDQAGVTIVGDDKATADDATWLYEKKDQSGSSQGIFDIYGNDGSATSPYTISTANQLLSFAYEVQNNRNFEGKYVKLDADITMQPSSSLPTKTENNQTVLDYSKMISWIGIGDATHAFNGNFIGGGRNINLLYGKALFSNIGGKATISELNISNAVRISDHGALAETNGGFIYACRVEGDVDNSTSDYVGSLCGDNTGFIFACIHNGAVKGTKTDAKVGGLLGRNHGTLAVSYHTGAIEGTNRYGVVEKAYDGSKIYACYYNNTLAHPTGSVDPDHVTGKSLGQMQSKSFTDELNNAIDNILTDGHQGLLNVTGMQSEQKAAFLSTINQYHFVFTPGAYPRVEKKMTSSSQQ